MQIFRYSNHTARNTQWAQKPSGSHMTSYINFSSSEKFAQIHSKTEFILDKKNRIKFLDPEENTNYIVFHNKVVEYYKKGNVDMKFKFDTDKITKGFYTVSNYRFEFDIDTEIIINKDNYSRNVTYYYFFNTQHFIFIG